MAVAVPLNTTTSTSIKVFCGTGTRMDCIFNASQALGGILAAMTTYALPFLFTTIGFWCLLPSKHYQDRGTHMAYSLKSSATSRSRRF